MQPYNQSDERFLLACMLIYPDTIQLAASALPPDCLYLHNHQRLFDAMVQLDAMHEEVNFASIDGKLNHNKELLNLTLDISQEEVPTGELIKPTIKKIHTAWTARKINDLTRQIQLTVEAGEDTTELVNELHRLQSSVPDVAGIYGVELISSKNGALLICWDKKSADWVNANYPTVTGLAVPKSRRKLTKMVWSAFTGRKVMIWGHESAEHLYWILRRSGALGAMIVNTKLSVDQIPDNLRDYCKANLYEPEPIQEEPPTVEETAEPDSPDLPEDKDPPFKFLGFNHGEFYYLPRGFEQVVSLRAAEHTESNLNVLAPLNWWEEHFRGKNGANFNAARNWMMTEQKRAGVYNNTTLRGRGAWEDDGRSVLHLGDCLVVDGKPMRRLTDIKTRYIYEASVPLQFDPQSDMLPNKEAFKLVELCRMLSWEHIISGPMLAGWCVVAPICGALDWRPHIWLTGGAETGKSWIVDNILRPTVGPIGLYVKGVTTEAGIRQRLGNDGRPVIHDEAEGEDPKAHQRMQAELELARQASSDTQGEILKGTVSGKALEFKIRSCFAFASIGVSATQRADTSRISILSLTKSGDTKRFAEIVQFWSETVNDENYCQRLRARTIKLIPVIRKNAKVFARAIAERLKSQRAGDQFGSIIAGTFSLHSPKELTLDEAREWVERQDWEDHAPVDEQRDEFRCLAAIMETVLRFSGSRGNHEMNIGEMIGAVVDAEGIPADCYAADLDAVLQRHGVKCKPDDRTFYISGSHKAVERMLEKTPWSKNWNQILLRLPNAIKAPKAVRFAGGSVCRPVWLSMELLREVE